MRFVLANRVLANLRHWGSSTEHGGQGLGSIEELGRGDGVAILGVDRNPRERALESVEVGTPGGNLYGGHDVQMRTDCGAVNGV